MTGMIDQPTVIYEDNHLLGLNKPSGWLVQSDHTGDYTALEWGKRYIKDRYNKPGDVFLVPVHRIDRPVSGTIVLSRTSKALSRMNQLIKDREITKKYWALSRFPPIQMSGTLEHYIVKKAQKNKVEAIPLSKRPPAKAKKAKLSYKLTAEVEGLHLLEVQLYTGRPHQIRAQLAKMGCPIFGDLKYGDAEPLDDLSIGLHSYEMSFIHPVKKEPVSVTSVPMKGEWWKKFSTFIK